MFVLLEMGSFQETVACPSAATAFTFQGALGMSASGLPSAVAAPAELPAPGAPTMAAESSTEIATALPYASPATGVAAGVSSPLSVQVSP